MGYAQIVGVREEPVRRQFHGSGYRRWSDELAAELGQALLRLLIRNQSVEHACNGSEPLGEEAGVLISGGCRHSTDVSLVVWTGRQFAHWDGNRGSARRADSTEAVEALWRLDRMCDPRNAVEPLRRLRFPVAPESLLLREGWVSFYWAHEDWYREWARRPAAEWPALEAGHALCELIGATYPRSQNIGRCGGALNKLETLLAPEMAVFLFAGNFLRRLRTLDETELERLTASLSDREDERDR